MLGFLVSKLTPGDAKSIIERIIDNGFTFLTQQGPYASFAIVMAGRFGWFAVWCINKLVNGKQAEIDRIAAQRDTLQRVFLENWLSSNGPRSGRRK